MHHICQQIEPLPCVFSKGFQQRSTLPEISPVLEGPHDSSAVASVMIELMFWIKPRRELSDDKQKDLYTEFRTLDFRSYTAVSRIGDSGSFVRRSQGVTSAGPRISHHRR